MSYADIIKKLSKDWNAPNLMDGAMASRGEKLPFSSPLLNWATYGGIPRDRITEFFGEPSGGKSTTSIDICKNAIEVFKEEHESKILELQNNTTTKENKLLLAELEENGPRKCLYVDLEHAFDLAWSTKLGINTDEIEIMQPPDVPAEQLLQNIMEIIKTNEMGLIVLDSIPSLTTQAELDKKLGERTVASLAGLMTVFCRKVVPLLSKYHTTLLIINQVRDNMDNPWVVNTPGGKALKFYASLRIQFSLGNPIDFMGNELPQKTEDPAGYKVKIRLHKQKSAPYDRKNASYYLLCDEGIKPELDYAQLAVNKYGIIKKSAAWFTFIDPNTGEILENEDGSLVKVCGMPAVYDHLENNPEHFELIKRFIENDINGIDDEIEEDDLEDEIDEETDISLEIDDIDEDEESEEVNADE